MRGGILVIHIYLAKVMQQYQSTLLETLLAGDFLQVLA
jgi:hypothetical protein